MDENGFVRIHWSRKGLSGEGTSELTATAGLCDIEIPIEPVQGAKLWVDLSPAPALIEFGEITVIGEDGGILQHLSNPGQIRSLLTGPAAFWTARGEARLISLGDKNLFHIDIAEGSAPASMIRLRLGLVETSSASPLAAAIGNLLVEERKEHEAFARQMDAVLEWQRRQASEKQPHSRPQGWLASLLGKRAIRPGAP